MTQNEMSSLPQFRYFAHLKLRRCVLCNVSCWTCFDDKAQDALETEMKNSSHVEPAKMQITRISLIQVTRHIEWQNSIS